MPGGRLAADPQHHPVGEGWLRHGRQDQGHHGTARYLDGRRRLRDGGGSSNVGVVLLTVLNVTAADSGSFDCVAENGVGGSVAVRNQTYLLVRRK